MSVLIAIAVMKSMQQMVRTIVQKVSVLGNLALSMMIVIYMKRQKK